jgi:hypothetical protein
MLVKKANGYMLYGEWLRFSFLPRQQILLLYALSRQAFGVSQPPSKQEKWVHS